MRIPLLKLLGKLLFAKPTEPALPEPKPWKSWEDSSREWEEAMARRERANVVRFRGR